MVSASKVVLEYICPTMGAIVANAMFSAPYKAVKDAVIRGYLGDLNPTPWAFMTGNTVGWVTYGFITNNLFLYFANCPGMLLSVWFNLCAAKLQYQDHRATEMRRSIVGFLEEESKSQKFSVKTSVVNVPSEAENAVEEDPTSHWQTATDFGAIVLNVTAQSTPAPAPHEKIVMGIVTFWAAVISIISIFDFKTRTRELIVGVIVNINLLFFYGAPLSTILTVLKTRNSSSIHIWTMMTNTANGIFWTAYGLAVFDLFIIVPNGLGAILGFVQIFLIVVFPRGVGTSESTSPVTGEIKETGNNKFEGDVEEQHGDDNVISASKQA